MRILLVLLLACAPARALNLRTASGPQVSAGVHAMVSSLPQAYLRPIADYLADPKGTAVQLDRALASGSAAQARAEDVASALLDSEMDAMTAARRVAELERVLASRLPVEKRAPLIHAARAVRARLADAQSEAVVEHMRRVAAELGPQRAIEAAAVSRPSEEKAAASAGLFRVKPINEFDDAQYEDIKRQIVAAAREMYGEARIENRGGIFPIHPDQYDDLIHADFRTGFSRVALGPDGKVAAFTLAYYNGRHGTVHIEKIGVLREHRRDGLAKLLLRDVARRALEYGVPLVDLLVVKNNTEAIPAYEKLGFENVTPEKSRMDPRANAFAFVAPTRVLARRTGLDEAAQPRPRIDEAGESLRGALPGAASTFLDYGDDIAKRAQEALINLVFRRTASLVGSSLVDPPFYAGPRLTEAYRQLFDFVEKDPAGMKLLRLILNRYAQEKVAAARRGEYAPFKWPVPDLPSGEFWDLASGPHGASWMLAGMDSRFHYRFFDKSPISTVVIEETEKAGRAAGLVKAAVSVELVDLRDVKPPKAPLGACPSNRGKR